MKVCDRLKMRVHADSIQVNESGTVFHSKTPEIKVGDIVCTVDDAAFESGALIKEYHDVEILRFTHFFRMAGRINSLIFKLRKPAEYRPYAQL